MRKILADQTYLAPGELVSGVVVVIDEAGKILALDPASNHDVAFTETLSGVLIPGYVNAHCHLELSHMKGKVATGTGLVSFIRQVVSQRQADPEEIRDAIYRADLEMSENGIAAVGDISNVTDSFAVKAASAIKYYTFVEVFDFLQDQNAQKTFENHQATYDAAPHQNGHRRSFVPHAPYSVSGSLFDLINKANTHVGTVSIHNQETPPEDELFLTGSGAFVQLFEDIGIDMSTFSHPGTTSVHHMLTHLDPGQRWLLAHNTMTSAQDIAAVLARNENTFWVSNPNANLYIENRLPHYPTLIDQGAKVCLGTDSLTSNWQLSIFAEMQAIARYQSHIPLDLLIEWATTNGAEALGMDEKLGRIEIGLSPGLNLITTNDRGTLDDSCSSTRLVSSDC